MHCGDLQGVYPEIAVFIVEKWSEEHPPETRLTEFLEHYPNALMEDDGTPVQPDLEGDGYDEDGEIIFDEWLCPCCRTRYEVDYDDYKFCPNCGQAIDWSVEDDD